MALAEQLTRPAPANGVPAVVDAQVVVVPPLDPRTRALVIGLRRALLLVCDVLAEYAGLEKRERV